MIEATAERRDIGVGIYYGWVVLAVAALAMVGTLPGRTQGLGLITEPLLVDLGVDRVQFAQINLVATPTLHYYFSARDRGEPAAGTAALAASYESFVRDDAMRCFAFGRGAERYKYRYANAVREEYDVRGFFAPVPRVSA